MPTMLICNGTVDPSALTCSSGWIASEHPVYEPLSSTDYLEFQGFIIGMFVIAGGLKILRSVFSEHVGRP